MPIFRLVDEPIFPPPDYADPSGLLAVGGDLSSERLLEAYRLGIFPWYSDDQPILWWSPDPRFVLQLEEFHISRSLRKTLRQGIFQVTTDRAFDEVIAACAAVSRDRPERHLDHRRKCRKLIVTSTGSVMRIRWRPGSTENWPAESTACLSAKHSSANRCFTAKPTPQRWRWPLWLKS